MLQIATSHFTFTLQESEHRVMYVRRLYSMLILSKKEGQGTCPNVFNQHHHYPHRSRAGIKY